MPGCLRAKHATESTCVVSQHLCPGTRIESPAGLDAPLARVKVKMNLPEAEEHSQSGLAFRLRI